jgi:uncharacterized lipoprotein YajG
MVKISQVIGAIAKLVLKSSNEKINQVQRNEVKALLTDALQGDLIANGLQVVKTKDGLVMVLSNDELGEFYAVVDLTIKNLDYDLDGAVAEYNEALENKVAKAKAKADKTKGE